MNKIHFISRKGWVLLFLLLNFMMAGKMLSAQNANNKERYNLAVYVTGTKEDETLSKSLQSIIQNKTITRLTGDGKFQLIERSNEFLKQIQNEQTMQQSGDVADGQIADIGAGFGAEKICVVSVTIIQQYLYIATRIVDVATKTSFESGDAEEPNYDNKVPALSTTLEKALSSMLDSKTQDWVSTSKVNSTPTSTLDFKEYKTKLKTEKGLFLDMNSKAYKEYKKYRNLKAAGIACCSTGLLLAGVLCPITGVSNRPASCIALFSFGVAGLVAGGITLGVMNKYLEKSFYYYIHGDAQSATINVHPYFDGHNTLGAGLTLRF